ncbi:Zinc finger, RING-type [Akanthomyces lecanii RCEF 1005]|uniref:Zinc finger, RING-type n=1 Tax=Akanthomyces lecanii RCEF 1005 TaxID=1081108 RepID=A0A162LE01_CORDF|nr:Zinc finger, RING-type [Akanthomyces lecanii RCEF 1005]
MSQQQELPFGYLSQADPYLAAVHSATTTTATTSTAFPTSSSSLPPSTSQLPAVLDSSRADLPDCFRTLRCDSCEMLFDEAGVDELRWTFPCGHVYCVECAQRARAAAHRTNVHVFCRRCANIIVRKRDNVPCAHQIPSVAFDVRRPELFDPDGNGGGFPDRYRLALGQRTGPKCQLCWLRARLQSLSYQAAQRWRVDEMGFPGELFACVQVDRQRVVHGLRGELPNAEVDREGDVELCRAPMEHELSQIASDICGGLGQVPMEPNFDPRGHIEVQYRLRGWAKWMRKNGIDERTMPVGLRAAVYGTW